MAQPTRTDTYTGPPLVDGRWRFPADGDQRVLGFEGGALRAHRYPVVELEAVSPLPPSGDVKVVVVGPDKREKGFILTIGRREYHELTTSTGAVKVPKLLDKHRDTAWYRPIGGTAFRTGGPRAQDVRQGQIGCCRLASSLQAIAATENGWAFLQSLFTETTAGWQLGLRVSDKPKGITKQGAKPFVDRWLPVDRATGCLIYGLWQVPQTATDFALWPALLEKALADMWGGYHQTEHAGNNYIDEDGVFEAFGIYRKPKDRLKWHGDSSTPEEIAKFLTAARAAGKAITLGSDRAMHNYALIDADKDGILVADSRTSYAEAAKRWDKPLTAPLTPPTLDKPLTAPTSPKPGISPLEMTKDREMYPQRFTWAQVQYYFKWAFAYDIPKIDRLDRKDRTSDSSGQDKGTK
jgi:hypothetical protein